MVLLAGGIGTSETSTSSYDNDKGTLFHGTVAKVNTRTDTTFAIYVTILMIFIWKQSGTSHGISACDGIGGTVKRPATEASPKRPAHNQILTPLDMFSYCESDVTGIKFFCMSSTTNKENVILLQDRYNAAQTVKGTRQLHKFVPQPLGKLLVYNTSLQASTPTE